MPGSPAESVCVRCRETWDMTEAAALNLLEDFVNRKLEIYESSRALARGDAVSRLSPYLHFGQISPRTVMARLAAAGAKAVSKTFWRRLVWRDLAYWQLHHWPAMPARSIRPAYERQEWAFDARVLRRWHAGRTGFPLVDAGMRELWRTGYMHQNVRMVVACFLTEYLNFHWVHGARWFHDTLVDADLAINSMMWQNAGKSGLDQWNFSVLPYSKSADSKGDYIRRCVRRPRRPGISRRRSRCHPRVLPHRLGRLRGRTHGVHACRSRRSRDCASGEACTNMAEHMHGAVELRTPVKVCCVDVEVAPLRDTSRNRSPRFIPTRILVEA